MSAIEILTVVAVGVFLCVLLVVSVVTLGIHDEERAKTFLYPQAPGLAAAVARRVLGHHVRKPEPVHRALPPVPDLEHSICAPPVGVTGPH